MSQQQPAMPVYSITISIMSDNQVMVKGFPKSLDLCTGILDQGKKAIIDHFIEAAKDGKLNDQNVIDGGKILVPDKRIVGV